MVLVGDQLEAGAAVLEIVLGNEPGFLEQVHRAVDGRERDARIDRGGARDRALRRPGWSTACSITCAMTRRWSVIRMPLRAHCSSSVRGLTSSGCHSMSDRSGLRQDRAP